MWSLLVLFGVHKILLKSRNLHWRFYTPLDPIRFKISHGKRRVLIEIPFSSHRTPYLVVKRSTSAYFGIFQTPSTLGDWRYAATFLMLLFRDGLPIFATFSEKNLNKLFIFSHPLFETLPHLKLLFFMTSLCEPKR